MNKLNDKVVLVTGGASGIGRLSAIGFAERGAKVIVWDINQQSLSGLEDEAKNSALIIKGAVCDVSDRIMVKAKAEELLTEYGHLDILVNNAGVVSGATLLKTPDEKIERTMKINVLSLFWVTKAFLPAMIERNSGHIVTIASAAGVIGVNALADYSASKFAAFGFNESVRMELREIKSRIKTTIICPFFINTGMFLGVKTRFPLLLPILEPEYVARRIVGAVLHGRKLVITPRIVWTVFILRLFPTPVIDFVAGFLGVSHCMEDFTGRKEASV
jgi:all-trans-retinol dehydrogenase (NAD+)